MAALPKLSANQFYAKDIPHKLVPSVFFGPPAFGKTNNNKSINISPSKNSAFGVRTTIVLVGGGTVPKKFGYEDGQFGSTVNLSFTDEEEAKACICLDDKVIHHLTQAEAWPERVKKGEKIPDTEKVTEMYVSPFVKKGKPKDIQDPAKGNWQSSVKSKIIVQPDAKKKEKQTIIVDFKKNPVSPERLPGMSWQTAIIEVQYIYFKGKEIGLVKRLVYLRLSENQPNADEDPDFLNSFDNQFDAYMDSKVNLMAVEAPKAEEQGTKRHGEEAEVKQVAEENFHDPVSFTEPDQSELLQMVEGSGNPKGSKRARKG